MAQAQGMDMRLLKLLYGRKLSYDARTARTAR